MHIHLDSAEASIQGNSRYYWLYPRSIQLGETPRDVIQVALVHFSFFSVVPNITSRSNSLIVLLNGLTTRTVTVPPGQYTAESLALTLDPLIPEIQVQVNATLTRLEFTCATPFRLLGSSTMLYALGFPKGADVVSSGSLVSSDLVRLGGSRYLSIESSLVLDTVTNNQQSSPVLARIPITADFGDLQQFEASTPLYARVKDYQLRVLMVRVLDEEGYDVDWQGTSWSMTLYVQSTPQPYRALEQYYVAEKGKEAAGSNAIESVQKGQRDSQVPEEGGIQSGGRA
jgi:hypothetical protein